MKKEEWAEIKALVEPGVSRWPTLAVVAFDALALSASWRLRQQGQWHGSALSVLLLSLVLLHAYLLLHEATHSAISRDKRINALVGHACGWLILMPFLSRQRSHLLHHSWTGHPEGDPANKRIIRRFSVMTEHQASKLEGIWRSWLPLLTLNDRIGMWKDPFQRHKTGPSSSRIVAEMSASRAYLALYAAALVFLAATGHLGTFLSWYFPAWAIQLALEELANLPHHAETPLLNASDKALPLWEHDRVTHSCKSLFVWSPFVLLNFNLHTAHHFYPGLPWSSLPKAHRELLKRIPTLGEEQETRNELAWALRNRKRPLLEIMGHYFDKIPRQGEPRLES